MEKIIPNTNELYTVTDDGRVFSYNKYPEGHELKAGIIGNGYKAVVIKYDDDKFKMRYVHRLVAEAFVPNPQGNYVVNHKDEDKLNNRAENLEWVTQGDNCRYTSKKNIKRRRNNSGSPRRVALLDENYEIERVFCSIEDAARYINPEHWNSAKVMINQACHRKKYHITVYGRKWTFIDNVTFLNYINEHPEWIDETKLRHSKIIIRNMLEKSIVKYNPKTGDYSQIKEIVEIKKEDGSRTVQLF